jgi:hypothetical protein
MVQHPIIGTWALESIQFEDAESGERFSMYGERPSGFFMINAAGHAMALIANSSNKPPQSSDERAAVFGRMMAYVGPYTIKGNNTFTTKITSAWHRA